MAALSRAAMNVTNSTTEQRALAARPGDALWVDRLVRAGLLSPAGEPLRVQSPAPPVPSATGLGRLLDVEL